MQILSSIFFVWPFAYIKWSYFFDRTPIFTEETPEETAEAEAMKQPEKSFWAKYVSFCLEIKHPT